MNIFNKVALQGLKKSCARTLVTIIGVALSAALITAVATFAVSLQSYMVNGAIVKYGDWHVTFLDADAAFVHEQASDSRVANVASFENIGYATLEGGQNPDKPYLFIAGFNKETFDTLPVELLSGRLPENSNEILVPAHVASNGGVKISEGDTLTLAVGTRQVEGETLNQHDLYCSQEEVLRSAAEKTYTVVGICQRPAFEERSAPGYTLITAKDAAVTTDSFSAFVKLEKPSQTRSYTGSIAAGHDYALNDEVLRFMGISDDTVFNALIYSIGGLLIALVMLGSVFLIYNSFNISLNERMHQFGILMSVGATEKQLRNSVLFEGLCIGVIGIPIGILIGIPSIKLVLSFVAKRFANILYGNVVLTLEISVPALVAAAVISMITILISAYIPAKKAAKTPVMECICQTNEVKVEAKGIRTSRFTERICGLEEHLALKNFKRNKRRYRSIILSLALSVVLFVSTSAFVTDLKKTSERAKVVTDYDISFNAQDMADSEMLELYDKLKTAEGVTKSSYQAIIGYWCAVQAGELTDGYWESTGERLLDEMVNLPMGIQFLDDDTYLQIIDGLRLPAKEYIGENAKLIAVAKMEDNSNQASDVSQLGDMFTSSSVNVSAIPEEKGELNMEQGQSISITCVATVPPDTPAYSGASPEPYFFRVIAPWSLKEKLAPSEALADVKVKGFTFQSKNPSQSTAQMQMMVDSTSITSDYTLINTYALLEDSRNIQFIVNLFTVVFIAMITLIAIANVFNTISTNIKLRRRELAMLRSVGMSDRDFNKMMRFECFLYGLRSLLFGLPIAGILSWLIYKGMVIGGATIDFTFPWSSTIISMLGVFFVIFITMLYATGKIRKENIIDALRDDMT